MGLSGSPVVVVVGQNIKKIEGGFLIASATVTIGNFNSGAEVILPQGSEQIDSFTMFDAQQTETPASLRELIISEPVAGIVTITNPDAVNATALLDITIQNYHTPIR